MISTIPNTNDLQTFIWLKIETRININTPGQSGFGCNGNMHNNPPKHQDWILTIRWFSVKTQAVFRGRSLTIR